MSYNPSQSEIRQRMHSLREKNRKPVNIFEKIFYSVLYFILVGWIVGGIVGLFKSK